MLFFISAVAVSSASVDVFKYISCYSLSILPEDSFIPHTHLNTSHVILYPWLFYDVESPSRI